ncbi:MAG: cysteine protease StiP family protein [Pseudomonadales bacterium]
MSSKPLIGSYRAEDCQFLLQSVDVPMLSVEEKERLLQRGGMHYSQLISQEHPPSAKYLDIFHSLVEKYKLRLAGEVASLAAQIVASRGSEVTLLSLARAGTPIGVLLARALKHYFDTDVVHYSVSIVRDKGIDEQALRYVEQSGRSAQSVLFVDGWTAKGVITQELKAAVAKWNAGSDYQLSDELCVISDIGGMADMTATVDDYTIPSGILNSTVSGLVSRTILRDEFEGFHQCVLYDHLREHDLSVWFVDQVSALFDEVLPDAAQVHNYSEQSVQRHREMKSYIEQLMQRYSIGDINKVKPGIAEATRVMLRRVPKLLIVRNLGSDDASHLLVLAAEKQIEVLEDQTMPFNAIAIVANVKE